MIDHDTNNALVNTFSERMVRIIAALPAHTIGDKEEHNTVLLGEVIGALRAESGHARYQRPIRSFYDLSTAHVSPEARQFLEAQAWMNCTDPEKANHIVGAVRDGWLVYAPDNLIFGDASSLHPDLYDCAIEARACGCAYILFDRDAETVGSLPVYEEDEESVSGLTEQEEAAFIAAGPHKINLAPQAAGYTIGETVAVDDGPRVPALRVEWSDEELDGHDGTLADVSAVAVGTAPDGTVAPKPADIIRESLARTRFGAIHAIHPDDGLPMDDPDKPADRRVLLDDESPTFGRARRAAQEAGKAALAEEDQDT